MTCRLINPITNPYPRLSHCDMWQDFPGVHQDLLLGLVTKDLAPTAGTGTSGHNINIVTCWSDSWQGFGLDIGFIDHLQIVTTSNYNTITDFYTLPITPAHTKSFQSAFTSHFLVTDFNTLIITLVLNYTPKYHCNHNTHKVFFSLPDFLLSTELRLTYNPFHGPRRKHSSSTVVVQLLHY
jgi:hypothetical protein